MNTLTHTLVAAACLSRRNAPRRNAAVITGALAPDASMFVFYVWAKGVMGMPEPVIWQQAYWQEPWQMLGAIGNSIPLIAALLCLAVWRKRPLLGVFAGAMLLHVALDAPVHAQDAHRHLWPLTEWRFHSPLSYWDQAHYALWVAPIELALLTGSSVVVWRRFPATWVRAAVLASAGLYAAVTLFFLFLLPVPA